MRRFLSNLGRYLALIFGLGPDLPEAVDDDPRLQHPSAARPTPCGWCGRLDEHTDDCPTRTNFYPVGLTETSAGLGCQAGCDADPFAVGDVYTFLAEEHGWKVACVSCAVRIELHTGPAA